MTEVPASAASPTDAGSYDWLLEEVGALVADAAEAPLAGVDAGLTGRFHLGQGLTMGKP